MAELGCESRFSWWLRWLRICLRCRRPGFNPWVRKIPWRRKWQPTPLFLPGKTYGWRSLAGYSPWGRKELEVTEWLHLTSYVNKEGGKKVQDTFENCNLFIHSPSVYWLSTCAKHLKVLGIQWWTSHRNTIFEKDSMNGYCQYFAFILMNLP